MAKQVGKTNSKFIELESGTKYIALCPHCNKYFQTGVCAPCMGEVVVNDNGQLIFIEGRFGYQCVLCPIGHRVAVHRNMSNALLGSALQIKN